MQKINKSNVEIAQTLVEYCDNAKLDSRLVNKLIKVIKWQIRLHAAKELSKIDTLINVIVYLNMMY